MKLGKKHKGFTSHANWANHKSMGQKKFQEALNGLVKEFIWANLAFIEEPKSNQDFEGIRVNKKVQKFINVIMAVDGNNSHDFENQRKFVPQIGSIIRA